MYGQTDRHTLVSGNKGKGMERECGHRLKEIVTWENGREAKSQERGFTRHSVVQLS